MDTIKQMENEKLTLPTILEIEQDKTKIRIQNIVNLEISIARATKIVEEMLSCRLLCYNLYIVPKRAMV